VTPPPATPPPPTNTGGNGTGGGTGTPPPVTSPGPNQTPPAPSPTYSGSPATGCFGGQASSFTFIDANQFGDFYESDITGGLAPDGADQLNTHLGPTYFFVGLAGDGHTIWAPEYGEIRAYQLPSESAILAAIAAVDGVRYWEVLPPDPQARTCAIYQAGAPDWPAPGANYMFIGTSGNSSDYSLGPGLPLYAHAGTPASIINMGLMLTGGTP